MKGCWPSHTDHRARIFSASEALSVIRPGHRVFVGTGTGVPQTLVRALAERGSDLSRVEVVHLLMFGSAEYVDLADHFRHNALFIGPNVRRAVQDCRADYTPIFLSEIPSAFKTRQIPLDVALIQVTPPDRHGFCSLGVSVDVVKAATESADFVVAEMNPRMPRSLGDSFIHITDIDRIVEADCDLVELPPLPPDEASAKIGQYVSSLIDDGSTIQLGIGKIPDAVLDHLASKRDLGIHTELFSDGVVPLVEAGVINGRRKSLHAGKIVTSFVMGTRKLYEFVDDNPGVLFHPSDYCNDPSVISKNDRMIAINSCLELDLTGQVCSDSIGNLFYSGIGGQVDFIRGAARSRGGKPIIALSSTARNGLVSRIVPALTRASGVVTTRGDVHYVVTEYGIAQLHGKSVRQRALALIEIAHPGFREELSREARELGFVPKNTFAIGMETGL